MQLGFLASGCPPFILTPTQDTLQRPLLQHGDFPLIVVPAVLSIFPPLKFPFIFLLSTHTLNWFCTNNILSTPNQNLVPTWTQISFLGVVFFRATVHRGRCLMAGTQQLVGGVIRKPLVPKKTSKRGSLWSVLWGFPSKMVVLSNHHGK